MAECRKCNGSGTVTQTIAYRDHTDEREYQCPKCLGSGRAACPGCGEDSAEGADYCSKRCERESADAAWENRRDADRDDRAAGN